MAPPAARVLAVLELLQDRPGLTGPAIAAELGVDPRTVRRYVTTLQEMGIPVEGTTGRYGGYRLLPGFRLPPLMFNAEEAVGLAVALLASRGTAGDDQPPAVASAFAKIRRVLPHDLARQLDALQNVAASPADERPVVSGFPDPGVLATLARCVLARQRCSIVHRGADDLDSRREVDAYGIVTLHGRWYVHGYCHWRRDLRTFRVDRIVRASARPQRFVPPGDLDVLASVERSLVLGRAHRIEIVVDAPLEGVRAALPRSFARLEPIDEQTTLLQSSTDNLDWFAWRIGDLEFDLHVRTPTALRQSLRRNAAALLRMADA